MMPQSGGKRTEPTKAECLVPWIATPGVRSRAVSSARTRGAGPREAPAGASTHPGSGPPPSSRAGAARGVWRECGERETEEGRGDPAPDLPGLAGAVAAPPARLGPAVARGGRPGAFKQRALSAVAPPRARGLRGDYDPHGAPRAGTTIPMVPRAALPELRRWERAFLRAFLTARVWRTRLAGARESVTFISVNVKYQQKSKGPQSCNRTVGWRAGLWRVPGCQGPSEGRM